MSKSIETKSIPEFLEEMPNVDVSQQWERFWQTLSNGQEKIAGCFDVEKHPSCAEREYYTSEDGSFEGSFNCYSGPGLEWLVHSWMGNRQNSLLDMNLTAFLGPEIKVPHLRLIFGTFPRVYFSADYLPRRNLWTDEGHLNKYYLDLNDEYLAFRNDERFDWFVSQDAYIRAAESPTAISVTTDQGGEEIIEFLQETAERFINRWVGWLDDAEKVSASEYASQQRHDHLVREVGYRLDPMSQYLVPAFGQEGVNQLIDMRMGKEQMAESRLY